MIDKYQQQYIKSKHKSIENKIHMFLNNKDTEYIWLLVNETINLMEFVQEYGVM